MFLGTKRAAWIAVAFLLISLLTRIGLALFSGEAFPFLGWMRFLSIGLVFDLAVLAWLLLPWTLYHALLPQAVTAGRLRRAEALWAMLWAAVYLGFFLVVAAAEFAFWGEFNSRFDFIAVDYLVYTHEVLGNIWESYPIVLWIAGILALCLVAVRLTWPRGRTVSRGMPAQRWFRVAATGAAAAIGVLAVNQGLAEYPPDAFVEQLSTNGLYALFHAYRHNELDYDRYYPVLAEDQIDSEIRNLLAERNSRFTEDTGIDRAITADHPMREVNVVLISVESLSAEYLGIFGNKQNLTPELDRIARQGLLFTDLYATGTRTVRGLEALSVGTPPTPGQSIVRRPGNGGLENLGEELGEQGWAPYWIYGGYGFFDNMNAYFAANHYTVVDRAEMDAENLPIHHENIWGIADEDLYSLALVKFDREHERGDRFFAHIMTTSNHRPYTFPEGRVDLPQKHREGAVKYTDWAIDDFLRRAAERPWFDNTLFIILADHTAKAAGKTDLPPARYHIPMIWYAPKLLKPGTMPRLMSQIDVAPTLLSWLGVSYESRFFGYDIFSLEPGRERAFISTYQKLGYLKDGRLVVLDVNHPPVVAVGLAQEEGRHESEDELIREATAWYQEASRLFKAGLLKDIEEAG